MSTPAPFLPYGRQTIEDDDIDAVTSVLRSDFLTTGPMVPAFEAALAEKIGASHAVVCANGTAALSMAAQALKLGPGSRVIVPSVTFLATANAPHLTGADIVFADVDPDSGLMRPSDLAEALNRVEHADALFNVYLAGQCENIEEIGAIARGHNIRIVNDACHGIGGSYADLHGQNHVIGSNYFSDMTVFSFHPVKTITTGEGGAVSCEDPELAKALRRIRSHGMVRDEEDFTNREAAFDKNGQLNPWYYEMHQPHFNNRITDIQCALGLSQLKKLDRFAKRRAEIAALYNQLLAPLDPLLKPSAKPKFSHPVLHLYQVLINFPRLGKSRAQVMGELKARGIGTQVHYIPVHQQPYYAHRYGKQKLPGADAFYARTLSLPFYPTLTDEDVARVCDALAEVIRL